ncbi:unnamed protein product [Effrenium voratum]|uniref:Uncharacterized protein n=1 Tax=Effrenium voratum TaxID=2562239 RepID=A0AA36IU80_9DINO|nr:unnamed protein product [Effrenium voratum]
MSVHSGNDWPFSPVGAGEIGYGDSDMGEHVIIEDERRPVPVSTASVIQVEKQLVGIMASMQVTRQEVLRGAPAGRVLRSAWAVLTERVDDHKAFEVSKPVEHITEFWSHSWHGSAWRKVLTLLVVKNGFAALVTSLFSSLLFALLFGFGILPAYSFGEETEEDFRSVWALSAGCVASCLTLLLWRPQTCVFLDRVCIDQRSPKAKAEGTLNVGAFLKNSDAMLALWDSSYAQRLWCVFELAAYLKSHERQGERLVLRPTFIGPCCVAMSLCMVGFMAVLATVPFDDQIVGSVILTALGTVGFYFAGGQFRNFYQEVGTMKAQMNEFRIHKAKSWCCCSSHVDANGKAMLCDRVIVTECIVAWFGSEKQFEEAVQSKVMNLVAQRLEGRRAFPYLWLVGAFAPIAWGIMDGVASQARAGNVEQAVFFTVNGVLWWLCNMPCLFAFWMTLIQRCHQKCDAKWKEVLLNLVIMWAMSILFVATFGLTRGLSALVGDRLLGQCISLGLMAIVTALTFCSCRKQPAAASPHHTPHHIIPSKIVPSDF